MRPGALTGNICKGMDLPSSVFWNVGTGPEKVDNGAIPAQMASLTEGGDSLSHISLYC